MKAIPTLLSIALAVFSHPISSLSTPIPTTSQDIDTRNNLSNSMECGSPFSLMTYYSGYHQFEKAHTIFILPAFIANQAFSNGYLVNAPIFLAWSPNTGPSEPGTAPFYFYNNPKTNDYLFVTDPKTVPAGFEYRFIIGYVYAQQICGSVPLFTMGNPSLGDHFYTVDVEERDYFLKDLPGWRYEGIAAYVIALDGPRATFDSEKKASLQHMGNSMDSSKDNQNLSVGEDESQTVFGL